MTPNSPGWYPDPYGTGQFRYFDGRNWTSGTSPVRGYLAPGPQRPGLDRAPTTVIEGPNHALHFILTLLTFWLFGGWLWVWLIVALINKRRVRYL
jgi:Protein of unknown function (DUF2510)